MTKLALDGSTLIYSTFLSGSARSSARSIAVDPLGYAYIAGITSSGFPVTPGAFQAIFGGGINDTFVTKLSPGGDSLITSTYLGGTVNEPNYGIARDMQGHIYVTGYTTSPDFPITPDVIPSLFEGICPQVLFRVNIKHP